MKFETILWAGGMIFTLAIFAVKVGLGLGYGRMSIKGIIFTLSGYILLFVVISFLSGVLAEWFAPFLKKGAYLHVIMAAGMIIWGIFTIRSLGNVNDCKCKSQDRFLMPSLLLIIPCPVCVTAITFSIWSALNVIKFHPALVGFGLGITFVILSLIFLVSSRFRKSETPEISLGIGMITIGIYFIASLFLPLKIEEAKAVYSSFQDKSSVIDFKNIAGALIVILAALVIGYFSKIDRKENKNEHSRRS